MRAWSDVSLDGQPERFVGSDSRPSINNVGDKAFLESIQPDFDRGIFVGSDPINDRVISTGDTLDGSTVQNIVFCEQGLSDSGELAFVAQLEDPVAPDGFRTTVFRATPVS